MKIHLIQGIDRRIDFEELARMHNLSMDELLTELESIVKSGMKINIDYVLTEIFDEETEQEIMDFIRTLDEDDLDSAIEEFGDEFTEEEIRLARIKFLSEMGN